MKKTFILTLALFLLAAYATVHADYKIILKSGGKFIASDYKKEGDSIKLYTPNGEIEIDKNNVESIKSVDIEEGTDDTAAKQEKETPKKEEKPSDTSKNKNTIIKNIQSPDSPVIKTTDTENKIKDLEKKNAELKTEEKQLQEESKKLEEDLKKEGRTMSVRKKKEFDKRTSELDKKVESHNQKVKKYIKDKDKNKAEEN